VVELHLVKINNLEILLLHTRMVICTYLKKTFFYIVFDFLLIICMYLKKIQNVKNVH
jgi:hypothetical protein